MPATTLTLLAGLLVLQGPGEALERSLVDPDPSARREAAEALAKLGEEGARFIQRETGKGIRARKRAILLAAALTGTPETLAVVEDLVRRSTARRDAQRAYALLLLGAFDPACARQPAAYLARASTDFERSCLLAGWLCQARAVELSAVRRRLARTDDPGLRGLLQMLEALSGQSATEEPSGAPDLAGRLLGSVVAARPACPAAWVKRAEEMRLPGLWTRAALREPARNLDAIGAQLTGSDGAGVALVLYELPASHRQARFQYLDVQVVESSARSWLWGAAGELGLSLPGTRGTELGEEEVAGVLELARVAPEKAMKAAADRRSLARQRLQSGFPVDSSWPAAALLALAPEPQDLGLLREAMDAVEAADRSRLHPIWLMASGRLASEEARDEWLAKWSRELGAGRVGFLDREGPRWVAAILAGGTKAAEERAELGAGYEILAGARDHPFDDEIYADLADLLLSRLYRWDLR